jgi:hypothetical protein
MKSTENMSKLEMDVLKKIFITKHAEKFKYMERFFTKKEIMEESPRYLYLMFLGTLNIDENELPFLQFNMGLNQYKKYIKK